MIPVACRIFRVLILPSLALFLVFQISTATAATFCVSTPEELQAALTTAANNGEDDEIRIVQGTYQGNFVYASSEPYGLTVQGGYSAGCSFKVLNPEKTVIDAGSVASALAFSAPGVSADLFLDNLTLQNGFLNITNRGAGLYAHTEGGNVRLSNCVVQNNTVIGPAANGQGGGLFIWVPYGSITLVDNKILTNYSNSYGGGLALIGYSTSIVLKGNEIGANAGGLGGAIYLESARSDISIVSNLITNNTGGHGALYIPAYDTLSTLEFSNNIVVENIVGGDTAAAISLRSEGTIRMINNTIAFNRQKSGGAAGVRIDLIGSASRADIYNNIMWQNEASIGADFWINNDFDGDYFVSPVILRNNLFDQSSAGIYMQSPFSIDISNLNNVDPLFVDPANGDFYLQATSPCINTGSNDAPGLPATDKDGSPRIVGTSVDMGAYEYQGFIHPVAGFSAYPLSGVAPLTVFFTDESTGTIDAWEWNFGDGFTSTERNPTHTYNSLGIFSVSLTAIGDSTAWDTETKTDYITVISPDAPDLYGRCRDFHSRDFGTWIRIMLQIGNQGNQRARDFSVAFYLSDDGFTLGPLLDYSLVRGNLQPGSTRNIPMKYSSPTTLSGKYVIAVIDQENNILELDETNNEVVIRVP